MQEPPAARPPSAHPGAREAREGPVKIPGIILDFLERATVGAAGTRDANRIPHLHKVSGWRVEPDGHSMTCLIPRDFMDGLLDSLEDNGRIAVTIEEIGPHETYQFKGRYKSSRSCDEEDLLLFRRTRDRFAKVATRLFGFDERDSQAFVQEPSLALTLEVEEIYLQTPGPGAGRRLAPPEER